MAVDKEVRGKQRSDGVATGPVDTASATDLAEPAGRLLRAAASEIERQYSHPLAAGLYLVATPIGNLGDITLRALAVLARADVVYCEDTRHSRTLMQHFGLKAHLKPYHEHNAAAQRPLVLGDLAHGLRVALISDAGTPLVSDPGYKLVREAIAAGHQVVSLPGPSALLAALTSTGLATDAFHFAGFLPPRAQARRARIEGLRSVEATLIFYEAPSRVADTLGDLEAVLGARPAAVARELTKLHEEVVRGSLGDLARSFQTREVRGECVLLVGASGGEIASDATIRHALLKAMEHARLKDAAKAVADALGVPKSRVYEVGLKLKDEASDA